MNNKLEVAIKNLVEEAAHIEGIAKIKLAHVFIEKNLMPSVDRLRDIAETLKNLDEEAVKRSDLLRFSKFLQDRHWFDDCDDNYYETLVNEFENLSK